LIFVAAALFAGCSHANAQPTQAVVMRDGYGMPYVRSSREEAGMYAFGYAQAQDRLTAILHNYKQARAELAEIDGPEGLSNDLTLRPFRFFEIAREKYGSLGQQVQLDLDAFCAGINAYEKDNPRACPPWAFRVSPYDVVAFTEFVNFAFAYDGSKLPEDLSASVPTDDAWYVRLRPHDPSEVGSNAFALAPTKTKTAHTTIVSMDPHLPWQGWRRWYQADLNCDALNVTGVTFAGVPYIAMGHTPTLAWGNTVNHPDLMDVYEEHLSPADKPTHYEYDGTTHNLTKRTYRFGVVGPDGKMTYQTHEFLYTPHGPVVHDRQGHSYAIKLAGWGDVQVLNQLRDQDLARTVSQCRKAIGEQHLVKFNYLFGDASGHIGYVYAGKIPKRPANYDVAKPLPGWTSRTEWLGDVPAASLPQAYDPPAGYFENCNDAPWFTSPGIADRPGGISSKLPEWMSPQDRSDRGLRMTELLSKANKLSVDDAKSVATDTLDLTAQRWLPTLLSAARRGVTGMPGGTQHDTVAHCVDVLSRWDMRRLVESRGPALFDALLDQPAINTFLDNPPSPHLDGATVCQAILGASSNLSNRGELVDGAWGDVHRHRRGAVDLPMDGGGNSIVPNQGTMDDRGVITAGFGPSFQMIVEMSKGSIKAWSYLPYGESDDPKSPHYTDQMSLATRRKFRELPATEAAVEQAAVSRKLFSWPPGH